MRVTKRNFIKPTWAVTEAKATSEDVFLNRREIIKGLGMGGLLAATGMTYASHHAHAAEDPSAGLYKDIKRNEKYKLDRPITPERLNLTYNNFYEFGSHKQIHQAAQALKVRPWEILIDGEVEKPMTMASG
jgi:sulfoxide reductase catalytic subunit YedY